MNTIGKYYEIARLDKMLYDAKIPHETYELFDGLQVVYPSLDRRVCDAVEHFFSYGTLSDRIELMGLLTKDEEKADGCGKRSVRGNMTANEVFDRIAKHWNENGGDK